MFKHAIADEMAMFADSFRSMENTGVLDGDSARRDSEFSWNLAKW
jgi:hypothetical protein